jgi:hypothetical protein
MGGYGPPPGAPAGPPMGAPPMGMPGGNYSSVTTSGGGSGNMLKAVGTVLLIIIVVIFKVVVRGGVKAATGGGSMRESISDLGIDKKKADPDKMIAAARAFAIKWKSDSAFYGVNIQKLRADGTVDLTDSNVVVEYFSPAAVSSPSVTIRNDSIKDFNFNDDTMSYAQQIGVNKRYDPPPRATNIAGCTVKTLTAKLVQVGILKTGGSVHAQIDRNFSDDWLVQTPSGPRHFDLGTCAEKK